jgi:hypothetical protein
MSPAAEQTWQMLQRLIRATDANRRRFTDEEKLTIVRESEFPRASAAEVCRATRSSPACCSDGGSSSDLASGHEPRLPP